MSLRMSPVRHRLLAGYTHVFDSGTRRRTTAGLHQILGLTGKRLAATKRSRVDHLYIDGSSPALRLVGPTEPAQPLRESFHEERAHA